MLKGNNRRSGDIKIIQGHFEAFILILLFVLSLFLSVGTHFDIPAHSGQQWRQRFVPIVPQPFTVWSAGIS